MHTSFADVFSGHSAFDPSLSMPANSPRPDPPFRGNFENLNKASLQLGDFVCPYVLHCKRGENLYLCSLDARAEYAVLGGTKRRNCDPADEWLFVELTEDKTTFKSFWCCDRSTFVFTTAHVSFSGRGNMRSCWIHCWRTDPNVGRKADKLPVFKILGFTFLCPIEWEDHRWTGNVEVNHLHAGHDVNTFANMEVIDKWSHRSLSGREGQEAKRRKRAETVPCVPISWIFVFSSNESNVITSAR